MLPLRKGPAQPPENPLRTTPQPVRLSEEKTRPVRRSVGAAIFLSALKLAVGLQIGSLAVLSEAANSSLDVLAAALIYLTVKISEKPADADHPYGHQKVENFAAFLQTGLVFLTCVGIVVAGMRRLFSAPVPVQANAWAIGAMLVSIAVSWSLARDLDRAARKHSSQALESHALNYRQDVWSSAVVLFGLGAIRLGDHWHIPGLYRADPLAAIVVVGFVIYHTISLGRRTMDVLLDAAPEGLAERIQRAVAQVHGVVACERARVRRAGNKYFVDLKIAVDRTIPFDHVPAIQHSVQAQVGRIVPNSDLVIDTEPDVPADSNLFEKVKWIAARNNLAIHDLLAHELDGRLTLDLHLEVEEDLSLNEAHEQANLLERQVYAELPQIRSINTHIETKDSHIQTGHMPVEQRDSMAERLRQVATEVADVRNCHDLAVREIDEKIYVSCHCVMDGALPITRVHDRTVELETLFRKTFPSIYKVTIHTEPEP